MENSKIEWCDHTFNPWIGCTKVSPGCANCYAEAFDARFHDGAHWGNGTQRKRTGEDYWKKPAKWDRQAVANRDGFVDATGFDEAKVIRPRVFCASLADWLDPEVPIEWLADLLDTIRITPHLDWLLLTKRPELWWDRMNQVTDANTICDGQLLSARFIWVDDWMSCKQKAPPNVWIGTSVEDQTRADERVPYLLKIPAKVRFLSCEPLLGPVVLPTFGGKEETCGFIPGIHWVICGGESGPNARPMNPAWARSLRDQCQQSGVSFFFKQWGEWAQCESPLDATALAGTYPLDYKIIEKRMTYYVKLGKKQAGRLLDGREWNEFPAEGGKS